jgi:hypothetical protein
MEHSAQLILIAASMACILFLVYQLWPKEETARDRIARRANDYRYARRIEQINNIWSDNGRL